MIRAEHLTVSINERNILHDVSLSVTSGKLLVVLGPNGAGKSTLLRVLTGQLPPSSGKIFFDDLDFSRIPSADMARRRACLPQSQTVPFDFTVEEIVALGRLPHRTQAGDTDIIKAAMQKTDVLDLRHRFITTLSGGEAQRVHLARVLAQIWESEKANYLFLDEPTSSLDPEHQHSVLRIAREQANQGHAVFAILHDFNLAARYADEILILSKGQISALGSPDTVLQPKLLEQVFHLSFLRQIHPILGYPVLLPE